MGTTTDRTTLNERIKELEQQGNKQRALANTAQVNAKKALRRRDTRAFETHLHRAAGHAANADNAFAEARRLRYPYEA